MRVPLSLLRSAEPRARSATPHPRLVRGGHGCRTLTTADLSAEIGEAHAPIAPADALAALSAAIDRAEATL